MMKECSGCMIGCRLEIYHEGIEPPDMCIYRMDNLTPKWENVDED